ncbi:terminase small subunit [Sporosarcina sp. ITBMC105]
MPNWDEIQREWETTKITLTALAEKHDVKLGTLKSRKSRDKWSRDTSKKDATKTQKVATIPKRMQPQKEQFEPVVESVDLTDKQWLFCIYYIKYFNATKAYQKAYGCAYTTARVEGSRTLANPNISTEIDRMKAEQSYALKLDVRDVLQKYIDIAFADITDFIDFTQVESEATETIVEFNPDGSKKSEKTETVPYTYTKFVMRHSEEVDGTLITELAKGKDGMFKVKLADKMKALDMLAKYTDLLSDSDKERLQEEKLKMDIAKTKAEVENLTSENNSHGGDDWVAALKEVAERRKQQQVKANDD